MDKKMSSFLLFFTAAVIYSIFTGWLFWPHIDKFSGVNKLFLVCPVTSACGVFLLSRRYVNSFLASLTGGAVYGFGCFACSFYCFYPFAFLVYAFLPFSFLPAVFAYRFLKTSSAATDFISAVFSFLPFLFIAVCYSIAARFYLFAVPQQTTISIKNFAAIINPLYFSADSFSPGFFHAPLGMMAVGLILFFNTKRYWIGFLLAVALFLSFYLPILNTPPAIWLSIAVLIFSVIISSGFEMVILVGRADAKWLLLAAAVLVLQAGLNAALGNFSELSVLTSLSAVSIVSVLLIFFIAKAGLSWHFLRKTILYLTVGLDIVVVTRNMIDMIF